MPPNLRNDRRDIDMILAHAAAVYGLQYDQPPSAEQKAEVRKIWKRIHEFPDVHDKLWRNPVSTKPSAEGTKFVEGDRVWYTGRDGATHRARVAQWDDVTNSGTVCLDNGVERGTLCSRLQHVQEHALDMSLRRFEIECSTLSWKCCECCGRGGATPGVFMCDGEGKFRPPWRTKVSYVYRDDAGKLCWGRPPAGATRLESACNACIKDLKQNGTALFSVDSGFGGTPIPGAEALEGLTWAEESLISRVQPVMAVKMLKYGQRAVKGQSIFIDRLDSVQEMARELPRRPEDVSLLVLERQVTPGTNTTAPIFREHRARRHKVQAALEYLIAESPAYADVTISDAHLNMIPETLDEPLPVRMVTLDELDSDEQTRGDDAGPAPNQTSAGVADGEVAWEQSGVISGVNGAEGCLHEMQDALQTMRAAADPDDAAPEPAPEPSHEPEPEVRFRQEFGELVSACVPLLVV